MRTIMLDSGLRWALELQKLLRGQDLGFHVALSSDEVDPADVEVAILWLSVPDYLRSLPNLKLLLVCGSGVDHIIDDGRLPHDITLVRLVDPFLREHVSSYVLRAIVKHLGSSSRAAKPRCGIMGLGLVGEATAKTLAEAGFEVCGWVRTPGPRALEEVYVGAEGLAAFARRSEILVCQLPLTDATRGILNRDLFALLPDGSYLINVGRGAHLNEADLLTALESGKLSGACLDVFAVEPLPAEHPLRSHPKITVTPHIAGSLEPEEQARYAATVIARFYRGDALQGVVDLHVRY